MMIDKKGYLKSFFNQKKILTNRKKKKLTFARNGASIYIIKKENLNRNILYGKLIPFLMPFNRSIDIDDLEDLKMAKKFFKNEN